MTRLSENFCEDEPQSNHVFLSGAVGSSFSSCFSVSQSETILGAALHVAGAGLGNSNSKVCEFSLEDFKIISWSFDICWHTVSISIYSEMFKKLSDCLLYRYINCRWDFYSSCFLLFSIKSNRATTTGSAEFGRFKTWEPRFSGRYILSGTCVSIIYLYIQNENVGCLIGMLIMVYYDPHMNWVVLSPTIYPKPYLPDILSLSKFETDLAKSSVRKGSQ